MPSSSAQRAAPYVLPAAHLCLCLVVQLGLPHSEWSAWFFVYLIDFPVSILALVLDPPLPPLVSFGIVGTVWWYLISRAVLGSAAWLYRRARGRGPGEV